MAKSTNLSQPARPTFCLVRFIASLPVAARLTRAFYCSGRRKMRDKSRRYEIRRRKKALNFRSGLLHLFDAWQFPTLAWG
ncbi:hypothetical protein, partial [Pantoea sp. AS-PWVM4]|uniref:hypothetical protein n=1 Tax=Pantoea sp. AS-PWVM4 TaxID=1332069 RepID=UPI001F2B4F0F